MKNYKLVAQMKKIIFFITISVIILLFPKGGDSLTFGPASPDTNGIMPDRGNLSEATGSTFLPINSSVDFEQRLVDLEELGDESIEGILNEESIFKILTSPISSEIKYGEIWKTSAILGLRKKWHQVAYSGFEIGNFFLQQELMQELINQGDSLIEEDNGYIVEEVEEIKLFNGIKGVRFNIKDLDGNNENIIVLPHITEENSVLAVISVGIDNSEVKVADDVKSLDTEIRDILSEAKEQISKKIEEDWKKKAEEIISELGREEVDVEALLGGEVRNFEETIDINKKVDMGDINDDVSLTEYRDEGVYIDFREINIFDIGRARSLPEGANLDLTAGLSVNPDSINFSDVKNISFDFKLENFDRMWTPKLVIKLISGDKEAIAVKDIGENINIDKEEFEASGGFDWEKVERVEIGLRIKIEPDKLEESPTIPNGTVFKIENFKIQHDPHSLSELLNEFYKRKLIKPLVADIFGKTVENFNYILENSENPMYYEYFNKYLGGTCEGFSEGGDSVYQTMLDIYFTSKNIKFLANQEEKFIKGYGFTLEDDREMIGDFQDKLLDRLKERHPSLRDDIDVKVYSLLFLSENELKSLQNETWQEYVEEEKQKLSLSEEIKIFNYLNDDIISKTLTYLDFTEVGKGSVYHNVIYWLGSGLAQEYDFSPEGKEEVDRLIRQKKEQIKQKWEIDEISKSWNESIRNMVRNDVAIRGVLEEMRSYDIPINKESFARYLAENYYSWEDIKSIEEELNARIELKGRLVKVFGTPGVTYQREVAQEDIGDEEFLNILLEKMAGFIYQVYDRETGLIFDTPGAPDANVASMGLGLAGIAALYQEGELFDPDNPEVTITQEKTFAMLNKSIDTLIHIQESQPDKSKMEHIEFLFENYPFVIVESLIRKLERGELSEEDLKGYDLEKLEDEIVNIMDEIVEDRKLTREVADNRIEEMKDNLEVMSEEEIDEHIDKLVDNLKNLTTNDMEKIRRYGWGGWLYHYISPVDGVAVRSRNNVELSPIDTALCVIGMKYAAAVFPELKNKVDTFLKNIAINTSLFWRGVKDSYNLKWDTDLSKDGDFRGFGLSGWKYLGDERIILDMMRIMWRIDKEGLGDYSEEFYPAEIIETSSVPGSGKSFVHTFQNASWTFEYAHNLFNFLGKNQGDVPWFINTVNALYNNRFAALNTGLYGPYSAVVGSQEIPKEGYIMSQGIEVLGAGIPSIKPDGTFSPYAVGLCYLPFESISSLWYQYLTNPMLWEGEWGFRDSFNEKKNFYSSANYTLNMVTFLFKLINATSGKIWETTEDDSDFKNAMEAAGFTGDFKKPSEQELVEYIGEDSYNQDVERMKIHLESAANFDQEYEYRFQIAETRVEQVINMADKIIENRDAMGVSIFQYYLENNDKYYEEALDYLPPVDLAPSSEWAVRAKALEFVIHKNQYHYIQQKEDFQELVNLIGGDEYLIGVAKNIIFNYDYEAAVMWKDWKNESEEYIPVISETQIEDDLENPNETPRTSCYPELEEYISQPFRIYTLFPEHSGLLSPYIEGVDYPGGHLDGIFELVYEKGYGWNEAMEEYLEEFGIQAILRPYVEELLGRKLELMNPEGNDPGVLTAWSGIIEGGVRNPPSQRLHTSVWEWGNLEEQKTLDYVLNEKFHRRIFLRPILERAFGHKFDLVEDKGDIRILAHWDNSMEEYNWTEYEVMKRLTPDWSKTLMGVIGGLFGGFNWENRIIKNTPAPIVYTDEINDGESKFFHVPVEVNDWSPYAYIELYIDTTKSNAESLVITVKNDIGEEAEYNVMVSDLPKGGKALVQIPLRRYIVDSTGDDIPDVIAWDGFIEHNEWKNYVKTVLDENMDLEGIQDFRCITSIQFKSLGGEVIFEIEGGERDVREVERESISVSTPTGVPTPAPTPTPTQTPVPTRTPTSTPTSMPTGTPTEIPTETVTPTGTPTPSPTATPTTEVVSTDEFIAQLSSEDEEVVIEAINKLEERAELGVLDVSEEVKAVEGLMKLLGCRGDVIREESRLALENLKTEMDEGNLKSVLDQTLIIADPNKETNERVVAVEELGSMDDKEEVINAIPALVRELNNPDLENFINDTIEKIVWHYKVQVTSILEEYKDDSEVGKKVRGFFSYSKFQNIREDE